MPAPHNNRNLIRGYIAEGRGFGHGEFYRAMLQLRRWNASPVSVQTYGSVPPFKRKMHFLSRSEWLLALLFSWIGCHVREQFPYWPWAAPHPLYGLDPDLDAVLPWSPGTLALCKEAGIEHGCYVGTDIPYIWTLDLVATMAWLPVERISAAIISVKPLGSEAYTGDIDPIARGPEKLEIERRSALEWHLPYFVADRSVYPGPLLGQLEWLSSAALLPKGHLLEQARDQLLDRLGDALAKEPPVEWKQRLIVDYRLASDEADVAMQSILWHQLVDVDLTRELDTEEVPRPGGRALRSSFRHFLESSICTP
jgi:hypothetical protein